MNQLKFILPLIALCIALGGCPYESKVPIDNAGLKADPTLFGKWEPKASSSQERYTVAKADDYHYKIEQRKIDSKTTTVYKAYLSKLGDDVFLNLYSDEDAERKYMFYRVTRNKSGTKVTLESVTENIDETFDKPEDLKAFFLKNKGLSFFFEKEEQVFIKAD